jgi:ankyrin repeat protein/tetratricopeptide (TPR) repeat protein
VFDGANLAGRILVHIVPCHVDEGLLNELKQLQDIVEERQRLLKANPESQTSQTETTLMQCALEAIEKGSNMYEAYLASDHACQSRGAPNHKSHITEWMGALGSIRRDQQRLNSPNVNCNDLRDEEQIIASSRSSTQDHVQESKGVDVVAEESDDDWDTDIAKSALATGTKAFEAQEWEEADSLLQEALRVLQQLSNQRRAFCDLFGLQYKLAVCTYQTQEPRVAEQALLSLIQQSASSDEHRIYTYEAVHLLSILCLRMGQLDRARSECEKALQGRRRLLGKQSSASLESTAMMAHIYGLLNNRARATSCLAMIPEVQRDAVVRAVEESLGSKMEHNPDSSSLKTLAISESDLEERSSRMSVASFIPPIQNSAYSPPASLANYNSVHGRASTTIPQSLVDNVQRQSHQRIPSNKAGPEERKEPKTRQRESTNENHSADLEVHVVAASNLRAPPDAVSISTATPLSRKDILDKVGCHPKDRLEEAVCEGDHSTFNNLLSKKKDSWRSKLRKRMRSERVTALHYAALFGEIDMARRLLSANFNINEVPFGYTTSLTPLNFAVGARQVDMVEFLTLNGARPSEPESWSTLAGQLMNRSWLLKTMSETEKEFVPGRIVAILEILLTHGWNVDAPIETSGRTVLHQAVAFWSGDYRWDLDLRAAITSYLCERGADPFQKNADGKTPYDLASASGHQDLLRILEKGAGKFELDSTSMAPVELYG